MSHSAGYHLLFDMELYFHKLCSWCCTLAGNSIIPPSVFTPPSVVAQFSSPIQLKPFSCLSLLWHKNHFTAFLRQSRPTVAIWGVYWIWLKWELYYAHHLQGLDVLWHQFDSFCTCMSRTWSAEVTSAHAHWQTRSHALLFCWPLALRKLTSGAYRNNRGICCISCDRLLWRDFLGSSRSLTRGSLTLVVPGAKMINSSSGEASKPDPAPTFPPGTDSCGVDTSDVQVLAPREGLSSPSPLSWVNIDSNAYGDDDSSPPSPPPSLPPSPPPQRISRQERRWRKRELKKMIRKRESLKIVLGFKVFSWPGLLMRVHWQDILIIHLVHCLSY